MEGIIFTIHAKEQLSERQISIMEALNVIKSTDSVIKIKGNDKIIF